MATEILMPRQGNSVESCVILEWRKNEGDSVKSGEIVCEVETDKATFEVESPADGVLLKQFFPEGEDVPVLTPIAAVGDAGEEVTTDSGPAASATPAAEKESTATPATAAAKAAAPASVPAVDSSSRPTAGDAPASPRARKSARDRGVDLAGVTGSGPGGRIIERDVLAAAPQSPVSPAARERLAAGGSAPERGSGIGGRILSSDIGIAASGQPQGPGASREIPVKGVRKLIGERMHASLQSTAQLTMNATADARAIQAYRAQCKAAPDELGAGGITLNAMVLYAVSRTLGEFAYMNAEMLGEKIVEYADVHLGFAVDTERGLMVPVIRNAHRLSLKALTAEAARLGSACIEGTINPDELAGATFTVTNLGALGVEQFTPVLNAPQVGILGVGGVALKPVEANGEVAFVPHLALSLTIDHRAVDGAPGARFLKALAARIANFNLTLAE